MLQTNTAFYAEIKQLNPIEKLKIVDFILQDLDIPDPAIEKAWAEEAERRVAAYKAGRVKSYSMAEVFPRLVSA